MNSTDNKKILLVVARDSTFQIPLQETLQKFGFEVILFDYRKSDTLEKLVILGALFFSQLRKKLIPLMLRRLVLTAKKNKVGIVLVSKGDPVDRITIEKLKNLGIIAINWYSDWFHSQRNYREVLPAYDLVFTADRGDVEIFKRTIHVHHLPYGGWPLRAKPKYSGRAFDIVFIGVWSADREEELSLLTGYKLAIWGNDKWKKSSLKRWYQNKWLSPTDVLETLSQAKITINQHQGDNVFHTTLNVRAFEAAANGAMVISDFRADLPKLFKISGRNKEMELYSSKQELIKLVDYYLKHDSERQAVAKRAFERVVKDHLYEGRVKKILKTLKDEKLIAKKLI